MSGGVNFSVFAHGCEGVELLLFDDIEADAPAQVLPLDSVRNKSFYYWHGFVPGAGEGQLYAYRVHGEHAPDRGRFYDGDKVLLDPYARAVEVPSGFSREAAKSPGANVSQALKGRVVEASSYDWEGDEHPRHDWKRTVIYEMHVAGFTKHPSSGLGEELRGTYRGVIEKIPYLKELGITAVELMPVFLFDTQDAPEGLSNYWGYSPISFFAPHVGYASRPSARAAMDEFRDLVKALHRADIEVILDVVYNHTAESHGDGPIYSYRGFANDTYYMLGEDRSRFLDFTGTGNTLNTNHSIVKRMIIDSLRYWVQEMHVDGFRFDLAAILSRDSDGSVLENPPVLWEIESDPVLANTKLIAEAWDAGGLYTVGRFLGDRWKEWNGRFRDDVRRFIRGDEGTLSDLQSRFLASPDLYAHKRRGPEESINFVTCHDGFTLNDLVSYEEKHNEANGADAGSGASWNTSSNHGVEGPSDDPEIEALRSRQAKNLLTILLTALGTPMLLMGDEIRRTQRGNNNPYCVDAELSWFDWSLVDEHSDLLRFTKALIELRQHTDLRGTAADLPLESLLESADIEWHGTKIGVPDFSDPARVMSFTAQSRRYPRLWHMIFNGSDYDLEFELPEVPRDLGTGWFRVLDTHLASPQDLVPLEAAPQVTSPGYWASPRSIVLLVSQPEL
ncbi:MAG: glycogen debranching enzyme GlgX [Planctomycetota bacterium]|nr:MAG: glycogen debranching enzyme GlgX [Planctomycetota bacterium]